MKKRIAINGFGRIGRATAKIILEHPELELVAINDLMIPENASYLFKYDSVYGRYEKDVRVGNSSPADFIAYLSEGEKKNNQGSLWIGQQQVYYFSEKSPEKLPWKDLAIDIVVESTGFFTAQKDAGKHIEAGAKKVVISGPSSDTPMVVYGVNAPGGEVNIFSCASCTTNNVSPVIEILDRRIGIKKAILNTTHATTASQATVDAPSKKEPRMGRTSSQNLIPTTTGAAVATTKALPKLTGLFDGISVRVPVPVGSISDITFIAKRATTAQEVNQILIEEAQTDRYRRVMEASDAPIVSTDIIKSPYASIVDLEMTKVVDGDLVKVMTWYDNEWGFSNQMVRQIIDL